MSAPASADEIPYDYHGTRPAAEVAAAHESLGTGEESGEREPVEADQPMV